MKSSLFFSLITITFITLVSVPESLAQEISTPGNQMVRLIYFLPRDRSPRPDRVKALRQLIKDAQQFYADEMEGHGFGRKTFTIETDITGEPLVLQVNGRSNDTHYHQDTINKVWQELRDTFGTSQRIHFVAIDISNERLDGGSCGAAKGYYEQRVKGFLMPASGHCFNLALAAHELGHAFALEHDFRDDAYIMSYGSNQNRISKCAAEWLDAHGFFNNTPAQVNRDAKIQMLAPTAAPPNGIRLRFEVAAAGGLHQAMLYLKPTLADPANDFKLDGCHVLDAESDTIEFVTSELVDPSQNEVTLQVIDKNGGMKRQTFPINFVHLLPPPTYVSVPDQNLAAAVRNALGLGTNAAITQQWMQGLTELDARKSQIKNLTGLEHATRLRSLELRENQIRDIRPLTNLKNLKELILDDNNVSDITPLTNMTQLTWLIIGRNPISDFTPIKNLTELRGLSFWGNNVSNASLFAGLTKLTNLWLGLNKISNITPLADLVNLKVLSLHDNQIRDVSPLAGLVNLETLHLKNNPIQNASVLASLTKLRDVDIEIPPPSPVVRVDASERPPMYWVNTDDGTLHRLIGDNVENLLPSVRNATGLAVDIINSKVYWTEKTSDRTGKIRRANLDGSNPERVKDLTSAPLYIAVDTANGKLYLINAWNKIQRMNLDGTVFQPNLVTGLQAPKGLAVDAAGGKMYWSEQTGQRTGKMSRANLDGSEVEVIKTLTSVPQGIALDAAGNTVYITNTYGKIQRMNLDGSHYQPNLITGLTAPLNVAVDAVDGKVYWMERGSLRRADLNGENIVDVVTGLGTSAGLVLGTMPMDVGAPAAPAAVASLSRKNALLANYPNPFNPETWIPYQLAKPAEVTVTLYAADGRLIRTLALGYQPAGMYQNKSRAAYWNGKNALGESVASGVYFYTLTAGDFTATRKMLIKK